MMKKIIWTLVVGMYFFNFSMSMSTINHGGPIGHTHVSCYDKSKLLCYISNNNDESNDQNSGAVKVHDQKK